MSVKNQPEYHPSDKFPSQTDICLGPPVNSIVNNFMQYKICATRLTTVLTKIPLLMKIPSFANLRLAAIVAALHGYPAIAVSAGMLFEEAVEKPPTFPSTLDVLGPAAEFTCNVIESLRSSALSGDLLPRGVLLNINYPALPRDKIKGVSCPEISPGHMIELAYGRCDQSGDVIPGYRAGVDPAKPQREEGDVRDHLEGYITISPVKPSWNPPAEETRELLQRLNSGKLNF